ncbi:hypothetical protein HKD37_01G000934 [Glycine soja]|nr:hypothetical protein GmHk_01G000899 [Glycine max]
MATNQAQTLMDYHTPTIGGANTIQLPDLPKGVTFDFKHRFLQMLDKNLFSGAAHEDPMWYMRKFIKLTNTKDQTPKKVEVLIDGNLMPKNEGDEKKEILASP